MTELRDSVDRAAGVMEERSAPESIERTMACLAAVLPILKRLEAGLRTVEKEAEAKYRK